jgi:hypothetical protein
MNSFFLLTRFSNFKSLYTLLLATFWLLLSLLSINTHAASQLVCGIDYNNKKYEWIYGDEDTYFDFINDSGQALASRISSDFPYIQFYDVGAYVGRVVAAAYQFSGGYDEYIRIVSYGIGEDGEAFGYIHLVNDFPEDLPAEDRITFEEFSVSFAYYWNTVSGFTDMADIIPSITGRHDVGRSTVIVPDQESDPTLMTTDFTYADGSIIPQYKTPLHRSIRKPQQHIKIEMLDAINEQCSRNITSDPARWLSGGYDSNRNFEFVSGRDFVRLARAYIAIPLSHRWSSYENGKPV